MLDTIRKGQRWLTLILVSFIALVFVFFMGGGTGSGQRSPGGNAVVELGQFRLEVNDFQRIRSQQEEAYREQLGDQLDARTIASFLDSQALGSLVNSVILAESARELGMHVSREEVQRLVRSSGLFLNESGKFDREQFESYANYEFGSQRNFLASTRLDLLRQKMVGLLWSQVELSRSELKDGVLYGLEEARIAYVSLETTRLPSGSELEQDEISAYLDSHRDELQAIYDQRIAEYQIPERVSARHILVKLGQDASEQETATARAKIDATRERIVGGAPFEEVAKEVSEDAGSRENGGDLGLFARGENAPAIEEASFALEPGDLSDVIRSDFGFHLIQLESKNPGLTRSFDEVGSELALDQAIVEAAERRARDLAEELSAAIREGASLQQAARARDLNIERTGMLRRRPDGFVPGLGASPELLSRAFTLRLDSDAGPASSPRVFEVGSQLVLIELLERKLPDAETVREAVESQADAVLSAKRQQTLQDYVEQRREELVASGRLLINSNLVISGT